eukprot:CAMPEP_0185595964 /NCGR_PEP_ID=MMETSP0434-20130131/80152_1 /TAXON_ID=626734 ORGANISM="Favella taraikaensis, Strain Fe Narragansett Bay" /NCGR_SAMPLE_ID=MMETSP0434 /ASSEMBLY_ACC=CAM_ASM_000379 /LENGTH=82 /DNA_ID=CAMNT_0028224307 /DNA_START=45 /DNA_END=293 /DNA_ORIENTATION=-
MSESSTSDSEELRNPSGYVYGRNLTPVMQKSEPLSDHSDSMLDTLVCAINSSGEQFKDISLMEAQIVQELVKEKVKNLKPSQ